MALLFARLKNLSPDSTWAGLPLEAASRLDLFAEACPLYARWLEKHPEWFAWLERPDVFREEFHFHALAEDWRTLRAEHGNPARGNDRYLALLRRFRRKMSMRIAYREVAGVADERRTVLELSLLAEFCVRECMFAARDRWDQRVGQPWDGDLDRPARFCIIALGKLGGRELNFSSDIDLFFLYEGDGTTRRDDKPTHTDNREYFQRLGETISQFLTAHDSEGFLFRTDLRLRPGGATSPLVPSFEAVENYYAATGQTWERLALLKARPIAGDFSLGAELLENLHSFRYPRHPPPSLLADVAAMKLRTEREIVGAETLARDVKSGYGGIREIEFLVQAMQLLRGGSFPFLQTESTVEALHQLVRYGQLGGADATVLEDAYWFLRRVEHRMQMAEEQQTHELPADPEARGAVAVSLGFDALEAFDARLSRARAEVRRCYATLFKDAAPEAADALSPWWAFFAHGSLTGPVPAKLEAWFGDNKDAVRNLRLLGRGSEAQTMMKEQVQRFVDLLPALDRIIPQLARPMPTLNRIRTFAERYGSRSQFFAACTLNPDFFEVLALLFDRSTFIYDLLTRHPEIFDEVLRPEILRKRKGVSLRRSELESHAGEPAADFVSWLRLYVRAEQVRAAMGQLLGFLSDEEVETELSDLAEATLTDLLRRLPGGEKLTVIALGKFGGRELSLGSDLDLIFIGRDEDAPENTRTVKSIAKLLSGGPGNAVTYKLDLRLRPHGVAGPVVPSVGGFAKYFAKSAQGWERQFLTRARVLGGPPATVATWSRFVDEMVFGEPLSRQQAAELWRMRLRIQHERDVVEPPERAFKTGAGGLVDIEFALQILQVLHAPEHPEIRNANTAAGWLALARTKLADAQDVDKLLDNLRHLKRIEWLLRRDENRSVSVIPEAPEAQWALVRWMGGTNWDDFWFDHCRRMVETRRLVGEALAGVIDATVLETLR